MSSLGWRFSHAYKCYQIILRLYWTLLKNFYSPKNAQMFVLKTVLKFTVK